MGPLGPLPWKVMGHILKSWDNDAYHKTEGLQTASLKTQISKVQDFGNFKLSLMDALMQLSTCSRPKV